MWAHPAETALKVPSGASVCAREFQPQQAIVLSVRSPQVWAHPAETALKVPSGGSA